MNAIKDIRTGLSMTQSELARALDMTQGNVALYERGQTVPPKVAIRLMEFSRDKGLLISLNHVYGLESLPELALPSAARSCAAIDSAAQGVV